MAKRDIVVIGASAGGVQALRDLVKSLPENFHASVFIVLHTAPYSPGYLAQILNRDGKLEALYPSDGQEIKNGKIYIAPSDHHLLIEDNKVIVRRGPKENRFRPSVDALFRSAAYCYGPRVIGIVLSGLLDDGTSGLWSVKRRGGLGIIQEDPLYDSMPRNVLEFVEVDYILPACEMGELLTRLIHENILEMKPLPEEEIKQLETEVRIAANDNSFELGILDMGNLTPLTCPECSGALVSFKEGKTIRFRCHTGHAFSASSLLAGITKEVEDDLYKVIRGLEETVILLEKIGRKYQETGEDDSAELFFKKAKETRKKSQVIHDLALKGEALSEDIRFEKQENGVHR